MNNPYLIRGPALVSFSGGRSSAYMLKHILDAHDGTLPPDVHVAFSNTGKERPQTLEFVVECGERWGVQIHWLEYRAEGEATREVTFQTASRNGEPFEALIRKKAFLPNPVTRFCTQELKVRRARDLMRSLGYDYWNVALGIRADEPKRVAKGRGRNEDGRERWEEIYPLADADVTKWDVIAWWSEQAFDLRLPSVDGRTPAGNCDLCFLKGAGTLRRLMQEKPEWADWWIRMEALALASKPTGAVFRKDRPKYADLLQNVKNQGEIVAPDDPGIECFCGD